MRHYQFLKLTSSSAYSLAEIGGKAFNLQFLIKNGLPVPLTYVLPLDAAKYFSSIGFVPSKILASLASDKLYAVRSSGIVEDGTEYSYAGMFDSYLNVSKKDISYYILHCVQSCKNIRLRYYERSIGVDINSDLAVIVQEMIPAKFAGICFTMNPVTNNRDQLIIEIGTGLGNKVVGGDVTPITIIINKLTTEIAETYLGQYPRSVLTTFYPMFSTLQNIATNIETLYKLPVDIEWASRENNIKILQSRPITLPTIEDIRNRRLQSCRN